MPEKILRTEYSEEMQKSYLDYSMSVITARAVPDIRDGLKPVQRRLLYDMNDLHVHHDRKEMKSARITGDCMGRFHPHGDSSIYETMVVLSQDFKKSVPLVDGKGNFGSIEGDTAAAYRYTEAKLQKFTDEVFLKDIDKAVDFVPTYANTESEPVVLPVRIPNFLLNGSEGIAVGMTTSTPCHNLTELCDLCSAYVKDPDMSIDEMLEIMPGPDFPTGGIIANRSELKNIYESGSGKIRIRGRLEYVPSAKRGEKDKLMVTEIPYTMIGQGIGKFMQDTADLAEAKKLPEITDIGNASDASGISIFIELKKDSDIERIKNVLYKKTRLEDTFGVNMLAISEGRPEVMTLPAILSAWLRFQHEILERKYRVLLEKEEDRREIQEGLIAACNIIDLVIAVIRGARNRKDAENCLTKGDISGISFRDERFREDAEKLRFTERQAKAILEMQLYKLIGLEISQLEKEYRATMKAVREYRSVISSKEKREELILADLKDIREKYGYPRRTLIEDIAETVIEEAPVRSFECVFVMDRLGYCRLLEKQLYEKNREAVENENKYIIETANTGHILLFTDKGNMYQIKCSDVPLKKLKDKGVPVDNVSKYQASSEEIRFILCRESMQGLNLMFLTAGGLVKQVPSSEFETNNRQVAATKLEEGDTLVQIVPVAEIGANTAVIWTEGGWFLRFALDDVPVLKKGARGVRGIKLRDKDSCRGIAVVGQDSVVSFGKKEIKLNQLKTAIRGGSGTKQRST
ncbi:MAG: DNA gyrase subunit A [Clostridiales bacterium]|nr:DNA gyrase subunit A [Clostridiales bacterium]